MDDRHSEVAQIVFVCKLMPSCLRRTKSRRFCLKMIRADILAGANLDKGNSETLLFPMTRFFRLMPSSQKRVFLDNVCEKAS